MKEEKNNVKEGARNKIVTVRLTDRQYDFLDKWKTDLEDYLNMEIPMGACIRRILDGFMNDFHGYNRDFRYRMDNRRRNYREDFRGRGGREDFSRMGNGEPFSREDHREHFGSNFYKEGFNRNDSRKEHFTRGMDMAELSKEERLERIKAYINKYNEGDEEYINENNENKEKTEQ